MIEQEVIQAGVPTDLDFTLNQVVKVNCRCYKGKATVKGYNYSTDGYILETHKPTSARPHHNGLCKEGHALWCEASGLTPTKKWSEWIENTTGKRPEGLKRKQKIKLKWSDGDVTKSTIGAACWYFSESVNITHYKVKLKDQLLDKPESKWTKNTGVRPVEGNITVMMKFSDGTSEIAQAQKYWWGLGQSCKIIEWRLADQCAMMGLINMLSPFNLII